MTDRLAIALAQLNPTVGGIEGNVDCILKAREQARALGADLMLASELVVCGYPPEDLVLKPAFIDAVLAGIQTLAQATSDGGTAILVGSPWRDQGKVMNSALLLDQGRIASVRYKHDLPNYGVFDEKRLFAPGPLPGPMPFRGVRLGVMVCEDMWTPDAAECLQESGAELLLVPNGSP
jgi:NAD+ synthase